MEGAPPPEDPGQTDEGDCPRCGAPYRIGQEYCLDCGLRLPEATAVTGALANAWRRRIPWYPGDWVWAALLGLGVAVLAATVVILADRGNAGGGRIVATDNRTVGTLGDTGTISETTPTSPGSTTIETETTATTPPPPTNRVVAWPAGRSGYTVVLNSLPTTAGRAQAVEEARRAIRAGLQDVGVLESSDFPTLHPGYYVVFAGFYGSSIQATNAVSAARDAGFPSPYPRQIAR
ncbi:MAG: zinc ribbon domain-containing protein [Actinomycetota bacterium]|nr:zinc ribbon domain-containing protein [Actinomycetota bacterium]